jgi:hypothetical protein
VASTPELNLIECRRNAQECWAHANDAADEETKALFQQIAVAWEKLGTAVESLQRHRSLFARFIVYSPPRHPSSPQARSDS